MNSFARNQAAELEDLFMNVLSFRNSVLTVGGKKVRLDRTLWDVSPVLQNHLLRGDSYKVLNVPEATILHLLQAHRGGELPLGFSNLLNLLAVTVQLELPELAQQCFSAVKKVEVTAYPPECSSEVVMVFFKMLVEGPLRTTDLYTKQLLLVANHCDNDPDIMLNATNLVKEKIERLCQLGLEPVRCNFNETRLSICIMRRAGELRTAVLKDEHWLPVKLFGKHFDLESHKIEDSFYLKYASYLLYKSGHCVYRRNLRARAYPELILEDCTLFLTRGNFAFAVMRKDGMYSVLQWVDDNEFVLIYSTDTEIEFIDFSCDEHLLAIKTQSSTPVFALGVKTLTPTNECYTGSVIKGLRLERGRRLLFSREGAESKLVVRQFRPMQFINNPVTLNSSSGELMLSAENTFVLDDQGLKLVRKCSDELTLTLPRLEYRALSELWLSI